MTKTNQNSVLRNFGDFLRKEVTVKEVFKALAADSGPHRQAGPRTTAASADLRRAPARGRLLYFPAKRRVGT